MLISPEKYHVADALMAKVMILFQLCDEKIAKQFCEKKLENFCEKELRQLPNNSLI